MAGIRNSLLVPVLAGVVAALLSAVPLRAQPMPVADAQRHDAAAASRPGVAPRDQGRLFRVERPGRLPSYVFGTLHASDPRVTALPAAVDAALAGSRRLAPEIFLGPGDLPAFLEAAQFEQGQRLADHFDAATLVRIRDALGAAAPRPEVFARLKPWAVLLLLARDHAAPQGPTLDDVLVAEARRRKLSIIGLELPDEQTGALDAIPMASQVALVRWTLDERGRLAGEQEQLVQAWLAGDLARIALLADAPARANPALAPHFAELRRHLIDNRNAVMAYRLFLPLRDGRVFVAVGASHLQGSKGLLALLREQGWRVRRVL